MPIVNSMNIPPELLQFLGSLVAILLLAGLARWMKLGGKPRLAGEADVRAAANEAIDGYAPEAISIDSAGSAAILRDSEGRILLLKLHGNKFAGRILTPASSAHLNGERLLIESGERRFGSVALLLTDGQAWADAVNALGSQSHA